MFFCFFLGNFDTWLPHLLERALRSLLVINLSASVGLAIHLELQNHRCPVRKKVVRVSSQRGSSLDARALGFGGVRRTNLGALSVFVILERYTKIDDIDAMHLFWVHAQSKTPPCNGQRLKGANAVRVKTILEQIHGVALLMKEPTTSCLFAPEILSKRMQLFERTENVIHPLVAEELSQLTGATLGSKAPMTRRQGLFGRPPTVHLGRPRAVDNRGG